MKHEDPNLESDYYVESRSVFGASVMDQEMSKKSM